MILKESLTHGQANIIFEESDKLQLDGRKKLYMKGICIEGGVRNHNQRVYPVHEIKNAVEHVNQQIKDSLSVVGEIDHPEELTINLDRISHDITSMWMDGNAGCGKLRILPTPSGNIIRTLIESEIKLGVSSRGSGNVNSQGEVSDFEIITVDIVFRPSAPNAYPTPVYEARNDNRRGAIIEDLARSVSHDPKAMKHFQKELLTWIGKL